jgi:hypothetical protein
MLCRSREPPAWMRASGYMLLGLDKHREVTRRQRRHTSRRCSLRRLAGERALGPYPWSDVVAAMAASFATVFMLGAVPFFAAGMGLEHPSVEGESEQRKSRKAFARYVSFAGTSACKPLRNCWPSAAASLAYVSIDNHPDCLPDRPNGRTPKPWQRFRLSSVPPWGLGRFGQNGLAACEP